MIQAYDCYSRPTDRLIEKSYQLRLNVYLGHKFSIKIEIVAEATENTVVPRWHQRLRYLNYNTLTHLFK